MRQRAISFERRFDRFSRVIARFTLRKMGAKGQALHLDFRKWRIGKNVGRCMPTTPLDEFMRCVICARRGEAGRGGAKRGETRRRARYRLVAHGSWLTVVRTNDLAHSVRGAARCSFCRCWPISILRIRSDRSRTAFNGVLRKKEVSDRQSRAYVRTYARRSLHFL